MLYGVDKLWDRTRLLKEGKELSAFLARQAFNQIPGMSAVAALIVGWWVASTFTTSPIRAFMARWGLMKGGRNVVSDRLAILEKAKEAELLSAGEYLTKKANLYNEYARIPSSQITDLLIGKLT